MGQTEGSGAKEVIIQQRNTILEKGRTHKNVAVEFAGTCSVAPRQLLTHSTVSWVMHKSVRMTKPRHSECCRGDVLTFRGVVFQLSGRLRAGSCENRAQSKRTTLRAAGCVRSEKRRDTAGTHKHGLRPLDGCWTGYTVGATSGIGEKKDMFRVQEINSFVLGK